ncbi:MAG: hypothetical protein WBE48_15140 [Xanthobacteraceae bacterium]|jgi:hypothetical protein
MALADQAARAHAFHEFENARPRAASFTFLSLGILTLCAISCAMLVTGCARNAAQREFDPAVHELKTAAAVRVVPGTRRSSEQHRYAQPRIRRLDPALLTTQPPPDCEYKRSDLKTVDSDEWDRLKTEYERQCYQDAEKAARDRLNLLQASIQQASD